MKSTVIAALTLIALVCPARAQDAAAGEKVFVQCRACHQVGETAKNGVGPVLNGLFGRHSGSIEGYNYSEANKKAEITWSEATFKDYIQNPMAKMPGTKMAFAGIRNDKEIADLWGYLKQFKANGSK